MFRILSATFVLWVCLRGTALADVLYTIEELLPLPGYTVAHVNGINDSGQVVGYSYLPPSRDFFGGLVSATLWDGQTVLNIGAGVPGGINGIGFNAMDINNAGQIVGNAQVAQVYFPSDSPSGNIGILGGGAGNFATIAPGSSALVPSTSLRCHVDGWLTSITNTGYMLGTSGGMYSPNNSAQLCGVDVSELYESGLALTSMGYLYDPLVDFLYDQGSPIAVNSRQWVAGPSCSGDLTGYAVTAGAFGAPSVVSSLEVSDQVAASICDLATGELHNKIMNESGQFIMNVGDRAFLLTPCSPFPGGGSTEGCFPGEGPFPGLPEPGTLALLAIGLAGLSTRRRKRIAQ